jgi:mRNA-degrading endonuclease toxin of MazEF toxin-antitoxin module
MKKPFDLWNEKKKVINSQDENKLYHEREVWWCYLGINIGYEQDGTGSIGERPVIIIRGFSKFVCLVIPLTTSIKKNPYHFDVGLVEDRQAFAILSQIKLIDTKRLINKMGYIDQDKFEAIKKAVKNII